MTLSKRSQREIHVEEKCVDYAEGLGFEHVKLDRAKRKWPDRLFLGPAGVVLLVEFKRPGKVLRPQQAAHAQRLGNLGHVVHVIDNVDDFVLLLESRMARREWN